MSFNYDAAVKTVVDDYRAWVEYTSQKPTTLEDAYEMQKQLEEIQKGMDSASTRLVMLNQKVLNIGRSIKKQ